MMPEALAVLLDPSLTLPQFVNGLRYCIGKDPLPKHSLRRYATNLPSEETLKAIHDALFSKKTGT